MSAYGNSAGAKGAAVRAHARRGLWRPLLSAMGVTAHTRRADAVAARWDHGAAAETATARMLAPLARQGWHVLHDRALPGSRANLDHVLVAPAGDGVVVLNTKAWHRGRPTRLVRGRVHCGDEDRHGQVEKVAGYAHRVKKALGVSGVTVVPLLVVHGSPVAGGHLDVTVNGWRGPVYVLAPDWMMSTLAAVRDRSLADPRAAVALAHRVDRVLPPYQG